MSHNSPENQEKEFALKQLCITTPLNMYFFVIPEGNNSAVYQFCHS